MPIKTKSKLKMLRPAIIRHYQALQHHARLLIAPALASSAPSRLFTNTPVLSKRHGGASASVVKVPRFFPHAKSPSERKRERSKPNAADHQDHLLRVQQLKQKEHDELQFARAWKQLEDDVEFNAELDQAAAYLDNLGADGTYTYESSASLADVDVDEALATLNGLASRDPELEKQVRQQQEQNDEMASQISVDDYNFLMRIYAAQRLHTHANALLARMERNLPVPPQKTDHSTSLNDPKAAEVAVVDALEAVAHVIPPDEETYVQYIRSLRGMGEAAPAAAVRTLGRMKEAGVVPGLRTYNTAMHACAMTTSKSKRLWALNLFERMQASGIAPNQATFTILMQVAIANGNADQAFETFHTMRSSGMEPDVVCFTVLIRAFTQAGRIERALDVFDDLRDTGLTPTPQAFQATIMACAKSVHYADRAYGLYHDMQELYDYRPTLPIYEAVFHACARHGDVIEMETILRHMRQHEVPMTERIFNALFTVLSRAQIRSVVARAPRNKKPLPKLEPIEQEASEYDDEGRIERPPRFGFQDEGWEPEDDDEEDADEDENDEDDDASDEEDEDGTILRHDRIGIPSDGNANDQLQTVENGLELEANEDGSDLVDPFGDLQLVPMDLEKFGRFQTSNIDRAEELFYEMTVDLKLPVTNSTMNAVLSVYANAMRLHRADIFVGRIFHEYGLVADKFTHRIMMRMNLRAKRLDHAEALMAGIAQEIEQNGDGDPVVVGMLVDYYARHQMAPKALALLERADGWKLRLEETHLKRLRSITEKCGIFTELIPESPYWAQMAGRRSALMEKRRVRNKMIARNRNLGVKYVLPPFMRKGAQPL